MILIYGAYFVGNSHFVVYEAINELLFNLNNVYMFKDRPLKYKISKCRYFPNLRSDLYDIKYNKFINLLNVSFKKNKK